MSLWSLANTWRTRAAAGLGAVLVAGCSGGPTPAEPGPGPGPGGGVPAGELQARLQQWADVLEEEHDGLWMPGNEQSLAWEQRKREATHGFLEAGAASVSTLRRLLTSRRREAQVLAAAVLADLPGPEAVAVLRAVVDDPAAARNPASRDHELTELAIEGLGRHGDAADVERLRPFLEGGAPLNTIVMSGPDKRASERRAVLQDAAAEALARLGVTEGMPALIGNLGGGGWARRDAAIRLYRLTGERFGFALDAPAPEREASIARGLAWWEAHKDGWKPMALPLRQAHAIYERAQ
jgi:hypothetical protein